MNQNDPSNSLDELKYWSRNVNSANDDDSPIIAANLIQKLRRQQRSRLIASGMIVVSATIILGFMMLPSQDHKPHQQIIDVVSDTEFSVPQTNDVPLQQPSLAQSASDKRVLGSHSDNFAQQLAMIDSSLSDFRQLSSSLKQLNTIDSLSQQRQYQIARNHALLDVLNSALLETN